MLNLIEDPWIPVRRKGGDVEHIRPAQITEGLDEEPVTRFASPRADLDGALAQFVIGLLHLTYQPEDDKGWLDRYHSPPTPRTLQDGFTKAAPAFELLGDGPRVLQDVGLEDTTGRTIDSLLIDAPGGSTLRKNTDLFVRRTDEPAMCLACGAASLLALQFNAPAGGRGHRVSLRGGGPMTTLLLDEDLWRTLWLNVLPASEQEDDPPDPTSSEVLLWMGDCPTSQDGEVVTPEEAHAQHVFWSMPRRILLDEPGEQGVCMVCGADDDRMLRKYGTKPYGPNYEGGWRHPLTPHRKQSDGQIRPVLGHRGTISYRHWLGLVQSDKDKDSWPAEVVRIFTAQRAIDLKQKSFRLWAFAYDMDNMKARGWKEGRMPLPALPEEARGAFERDVARLVKAADHAASATRTAVWRGLISEHSESRGDINHVSDSFWTRTEPRFFEELEAMAATHTRADETSHIRGRWLAHLRREAMEEFDERVVGDRIGADQVRRIARARRKLLSTLSGTKMHKALDLRETNRHTKEVS